MLRHAVQKPTWNIQWACRPQLNWYQQQQVIVVTHQRAIHGSHRYWADSSPQGSSPAPPRAPGTIVLPNSVAATSVRTTAQSPLNQPGPGAIGGTVPSSSSAGTRVPPTTTATTTSNVAATSKSATSAPISGAGSGSRVQTAPPTSIPPASRNDLGTDSPMGDRRPAGNTTRSNPQLVRRPSTVIPPPPPPSSSSLPPSGRKKRSGRFRRFLLTLFTLAGLGYAGGVYYSLVNDNFHDFFTEYVPWGESAVLFFEEREYRRRFPQPVSRPSRPKPEPSAQVTIPSKSGVSWKVTESEPDKHDLQSLGKTSVPKSQGKEQEAKAVSVQTAQQEPSQATGLEKNVAVEEAKKAAAPSLEASSAATPKSSKESPDALPSSKAPNGLSSPTALTKSKITKSPQVDEPSEYLPVSPIDPLKISHADEPLVHDLVKIVNDIITVVNNDASSRKYYSTLSKAKDELAGVGARIIQLKEGERQEAEKQIRALESQFDSSAKDLVSRLEQEMTAQQSRWRDEYDREREELAKSYESRLATELKRAGQVAEKKTENTLAQQSIALKKRFLDTINERVDTERGGRLARLEELAESVSELEKLTASWNEVIDANLQSQHLQVAVEAVRSSLESADRPRPFVRELVALKELAPSNDSLISAAIASINPSAYQRGVPTSAQLIDRFRRVAHEVRKASLLPSDGTEAGVATHAASYLFSKMMFKKYGPTNGDDVESTLSRAETLLEEGRLDEATREMNTLQGWAKTLSWDWMCEARRVLEVRQAIDIIATSARLQALRVDNQ